MCQFRALVLAALVGSCASATALAGPLTPPNGPVASTYKTLTEVEPRIAINSTNTPGDNDATPSVYRITQPGSYYLTANLAGVAGKRCIEVAADDVTIDLNGMTIAGAPTSLAGIYIEGARSNIAIHNGAIRSIGTGPGIDFGFSGGNGWQIDSVRVSACAGIGINTPTGTVIQSCRAYSNTGIGIKVSDNGRIISCDSQQNSIGVQVGNNSIVTHTTCANNTGTGIDASSDGAHVVECNASNNAGNGIIGLNGARIEGCVVRFNNLAGISTNSSCIIEDNEVTFSGANGIATLSNCAIRNNSCQSNGRLVPGAGIFTSSTRCRIEGNTCTDNTHGIRVTGSANFISRNCVGGNSTLNWDIAMNNRCLVVQAASNAAFTGNSGGTAPGSTDPNANFTY